jgi:hypothetical protein
MVLDSGSAFPAKQAPSYVKPENTQRRLPRPTMKLEPNVGNRRGSDLVRSSCGVPIPKPLPLVAEMNIHHGNSINYPIVAAEKRLRHNLELKLTYAAVTRSSKMEVSGCNVPNSTSEAVTGTHSCGPV